MLLKDSPVSNRYQMGNRDPSQFPKWSFMDAVAFFIMRGPFYTNRSIAMPLITART